jgi:hypothetical protein
MDDITKAYDGKVQMIDTSTVRVHQHAAGKGVEIVPQSRRIDTCCRRCPGPTYLSDAYCRQVHDNHGARELLVDLDSGTVVGDKAYDADWIRAQIKEQGAVTTFRTRPTGHIVIDAKRPSSRAKPHRTLL